MNFIADLHIHGRFAQACSKTTTIEDLERNARIKGLNLLGTGDMQHPLWNKEINSKLSEDENGILWTKTKFPFIWQTEISLMYTHNGKGRRIHHLVFAPNKEVVDQFTAELLKRGRIDYDGRPIFGFNSIEFIDMLRSISKDIEVIPAHILTPYFGILGSKSGYNSVEECFEDRAKYIHALETGISSDPLMDRRISKLDKYKLVSFSDPHSSHPWRLGREATIFDIKKLDYKSIINAIRNGEGLNGTIEANPSYGRYHVDGHRDCKIFLTPKETKRLNGICPKCGKALTIGVEYRIEELADRSEGIKPVNAIPFKNLIPLQEIIAEALGVTSISKKVEEMYNNLINKFGSEFEILLNASISDLESFEEPRIAEGVKLVREGKLRVEPGYDGVYGKVKIFSGNENKGLEKQKKLF